MDDMVQESVVEIFKVRSWFIVSSIGIIIRDCLILTSLSGIQMVWIKPLTWQGF